MKIVDLQTFVGLPSGTFYHEYEPCVVSGPIRCKYDTLSANEWVEQEFWTPESGGSGELFSRLDLMEQTGASFPLEVDMAGRHGLFPGKGLFLVYEQDDIVRLIEHMAKCSNLDVKVERKRGR